MDTVAALFVQTNGCYFGIDGVDPWDEPRDARKYRGPHPVVAHPPCKLWCKMAPVNYARYGGEHNRPGNDGGCFAAALRAVGTYGGVLEHPQSTLAWTRFGIAKPVGGRWIPTGQIGWTCCVWQSAYGHRANKATWLYYSGKRPPFDLNWDRPKGSHQVGWTDHGRSDPSTNKPTLSKKESNATPLAFRDVLIELARWSRGQA